VKENRIVLNRRDALKVLGTGPAGILIAEGCSLRQKSEEKKHVDVVVVGAGFAGMIAARNLRRAGKTVVVLEARDRVGGRIKAGTIAGKSVDVGGMWVGPTQTRLLSLIKEYGLSTYPQFESGNSITELAGKQTQGKEEDAGLDPKTEKDLELLVQELDRLSSQVPLDSPWSAPHAAEFDSITVEEWIVAHTQNEAVRGFFRAVNRTYISADAKQISFLFFLFYIRSCDKFETMYGIKDAAQAFRISSGMHGLAASVAKELGDSIVLRAPVTAISQYASGASVLSDAGEWSCDFVVVAVPLPLSVRIAYNPPLPAHRDILAQRMPMGSIIKFWVAYERPFWREHSWNGLVFSDVPPSAGVYDGTLPEGGVGLLVGFIDADGALKLTGLPREERKKVVVGRLVDWLGAEAGHPIDYEDNDWPSEQYSRGCYEAWTFPGVLTTVGKSMREPIGRIHWAGTETSEKWMGYVDGAIRSGERAATEVLEADKESPHRVSVRR
jgi:monoamine oxidase